MGGASRPYRPELLLALRDIEEAAAYLDAALEEGSDELFLRALRDVMEAHGMSELFDQGNPQLASLTAILRQMGLALSIKVDRKAA